MADTMKDKLWALLRRNLSRVLSQLNRDQDSPLFGSFDRNFWHYKIRDFSSMILQQGMLIPAILKDHDLEGNAFYRHPLMDTWIEGSLKFWASKQLRSGSFNEYYPFEEGFPPTAFSLYAVGLILKNRDLAKPGGEVYRAVQKACDWLSKHIEKDALNQEAAALAGLTLCSKIDGIKVDKARLEARLSEFYERQSPEGWFPEYDGPDTGYLSVTIDCLWDIYEATADQRALQAMNKAVQYIASMISVSGETPVMINSRNTDYIVFYGITRMAKDNPAASMILEQLINNTTKPDHYLNRTDDRYISHYVYQSCFRSLPYLDEICHGSDNLPAGRNKKILFKEAGILIKHVKENTSLYVNARKGGIINVFGVNGIKDVDFGWRAHQPGGKIAVTHWLSRYYEVDLESDNSMLIKGRMSSHSWMKPTPFKHFVLRATSYFFGNRLIPWLKKVMIFGDKETGISFERKITLYEDRIEVRDVFKGAELPDIKLYRAPHYSLRHVSSAGLFVPEELIGIPKAVAVTETEALPGDESVPEAERKAVTQVDQVLFKRTIKL